MKIIYMIRDINNIPEPAFGSELNTVIVELEKLREKQLHGTVPPYVFFQLKEIFQALESLGSARIEGNRTTVSEYAEKIIAGVKPDKDEAMREILNVDKAINFIVDKAINFIEKILLQEHQLLVQYCQKFIKLWLEILHPIQKERVQGLRVLTVNTLLKFKILR